MTRQRPTIGSRFFLGAIIATIAFVAADSPAQAPAAEGRRLELGRPEWRLYVPDDYRPRPDGAVDLLVHFHGDPPTVWRNASAARLNAVVVTVNYRGLSSAYSTPFSDPALFQAVLDDALDRLRKEADFEGSQWGHLAVSSFSAGYGAVREILKQPAYLAAIDGVLAADSLYASTEADGTPVDAQMADYKRLADLAAAGEKTFVFTHSQVATPTYESTVETGDELLEHLGLEATPTDTAGLGPLRFYRKASRGRFSLWGAVGDDGDAHMSHLRHMAEWLDDLPLDRHAADD